ncbi:hypothetical protein BGY98DRAFT_428635 [Russula aff. rugulosa BPL654]|nr:hypothetical protein BGY98DRAFT_428635 [Russula aff. rugulosa BPL654]
MARNRCTDRNSLLPLHILPDSPSGPTPHTALAPSYAAHAATLGPTNFKLRQRRIRIRVPIMTLPAHCPAPLSFLSLFLTLRLCSRTLEQCLPTLSCYHAASVRSHLPYFIFPFMHLYALFNLHHRRPRGRLYDTDLISITFTPLFLVDFSPLSFSFSLSLFP